MMKIEEIEVYLSSLVRSLVSRINCLYDERFSPYPNGFVSPNDFVVTGGCIARMLHADNIVEAFKGGGDFDVLIKNNYQAKVIFGILVDKFNKSTGSNWHITVEEDSRYHRISCKVKSSGIATRGADPVTYQFFEQTDGDEAESWVEETVAFKQFENKEEAIANYFCPVCITQNAITISFIPAPIQLISAPRKDAEKFMGPFDFKHCQATFENGTLHISAEQMNLIAEKRLRYNNESLFPLSSLVRLRKYIKNGWYISAGELVKLALHINSLNLYNADGSINAEELRHQLMGVDVAYFNELCVMIAHDTSIKDIDASYLVQLIDRLADI